MFYVLKYSLEGQGLVYIWKLRMVVNKVWKNICELLFDPVKRDANEDYSIGNCLKL